MHARLVSFLCTIFAICSFPSLVFAEDGSKKSADLPKHGEVEIAAEEFKFEGGSIDATILIEVTGGETLSDDDYYGLFVDASEEHVQFFVAQHECLVCQEREIGGYRLVDDGKERKMKKAPVGTLLHCVRNKDCDEKTARQDPAAGTEEVKP